MSPPPPGHRPRAERGVVIVYPAFFVIFLLGFLALAVDATKLLAARVQLQRTADAAALAGASAIDLETGAIDPDTAIVRAQETAALNKAYADGATSVTLAVGDIEFPKPLQVKVTARREVGDGGSVVTYIARVIGIKNLEMKADATAEADTAARPCDGLVPMAPVEPPNSGWFDPDCSKTYQLKVGSGNGQQGNYELLDFPPCNEGPCANLNGGAAIRCYAEHGYGCCLEQGQEMVLTQPRQQGGVVPAGHADPLRLRYRPTRRDLLQRIQGQRRADRAAACRSELRRQRQEDGENREVLELLHQGATARQRHAQGAVRQRRDPRRWRRHRRRYPLRATPDRMSG